MFTFVYKLGLDKFLLVLNFAVIRFCFNIFVMAHRCNLFAPLFNYFVLRKFVRDRLANLDNDF